VLGRKEESVGVANKEELLLLTAPKETDIVYDSLHIRSLSDFASEQMKDTIEINTVSKMYKGAETFKGSHLKAICNKYFLAVVSIDTFRGIFPDKAAKAILDFTNANKTTMMTTSRLYIMAHKKWFRGSMSDKLIKGAFIIFYKENNNDERANGMYIVDDSNATQIYSSGNDFSDLNRITKYYTMEGFNKEAEPPIGIPNYIMTFLYVILMSLAIYYASFLNIVLVNLVFLFGAIRFNWNPKYKKYWNSIPKERGYAKVS
tara:strand:+ start:219918 stop:220697 length:780 start_codon:yes stop_codon:yes gene_type:complete